MTDEIIDLFSDDDDEEGEVETVINFDNDDDDEAKKKKFKDEDEDDDVIDLDLDSDDDNEDRDDKVKRDGRNCQHCLQPLAEVKTRPASLPDALSESRALRTPLLSLQNGHEDEEDDVQLLLHDFYFYDESDHVVQLNSSLIQAGKAVFFDGGVSPIGGGTAADGGGGGVRVCKVGPVVEWWNTGFRKGENIVTGVSTAGGKHYYLRRPHEAYGEMMAELRLKRSLTKLIVEILDETFEYQTDLTFDDLLTKMDQEINKERSNFAHLLGNFSLREDLISHAGFIINEITSYESAADDDEDVRMMGAGCIKTLASYAGKLSGLSDPVITNHLEGVKSLSQAVLISYVTRNLSYQGLLLWG